MPGTLAWERAGRLASPTEGQTPGRNAGLKPGPDDAPATAYPADRSGQSAEDISPSPHRHGAGAQPQHQARPWVETPGLQLRRNQREGTPASAGVNQTKGPVFQHTFRTPTRRGRRRPRNRSAQKPPRQSATSTLPRRATPKAARPKPPTEPTPGRSQETRARHWLPGPRNSGPDPMMPHLG